jgi:hypothetical protein
MRLMFGSGLSRKNIESAGENVKVGKMTDKRGRTHILTNMAVTHAASLFQRPGVVRLSFFSLATFHYSINI